MTKKSNIITQFRSAKSGEFVTEKYAKTHPATTVKENNKLSPTNNKPKGK
jgi:hypothetical protein